MLNPSSATGLQEISKLTETHGQQKSVALDLRAATAECPALTSDPSASRAWPVLSSWLAFLCLSIFLFLLNRAYFLMAFRTSCFGAIAQSPNSTYQNLSFRYPKDLPERMAQGCSLIRMLRNESVSERAQYQNEY